MSVILFVRIETALSPAEIETRINERVPQFRAVRGLQKKLFGRGADGSVCGIYVFESQAALDAYRDSNLARSIADAYAAMDVRRETYDLVSSVDADASATAD